MNMASGSAAALNTTNGERSFFAASALVFIASAALTVAWTRSMSAMGEMRMPGGWTMSTAWMGIPGSSRIAAASAFLGMWMVMMAAMMLPSFVPMLYRYRRAVLVSPARLDRLTALVAAGYFFVWAIIGLAAFPIGVAFATIATQQPALARIVPIAIGGVVLFSGALQFTSWKSRHLACCREHPSQLLLPDTRYAWRYGIHLGLHCAQCCGALIAILLVIGVMDLRAMAVVAAAITIERLAPGGNRVVHITGALLVGTSLFLIALSFK
jgi:predicted metal-binding membrane protein